MFEAAAGYSLYAIAATDETDLFLSWTVVGFGVIILAMLKPASALVTIVFFATSLGSIQATTIAVTASGTGTSLDTLNSVELQVLSTADVVFALTATQSTRHSPQFAMGSWTRMSNSVPLAPWASSSVKSVTAALTNTSSVMGNPAEGAITLVLSISVTGSRHRVTPVHLHLVLVLGLCQHRSSIV